MTKFIARFSNGLVITAKDQRRSYTHAWHATGRHAIGNEPWSFNGFGTSAERARGNMANATQFGPKEKAPPKRGYLTGKGLGGNGPSGPAHYQRAASTSVPCHSAPISA